MGELLDRNLNIVVLMGGWSSERSVSLMSGEGVATALRERGFSNVTTIDMSIHFVRPEVDELRPRISVIGVGGAGGNAIANMIRSDVQGVEFLVANTDAQALNASAADRRIQLGLKITQGLGAGSRPEIGRAAAEETLDEIERMAQPGSAGGGDRRRYSLRQP